MVQTSEEGKTPKSNKEKHERATDPRRTVGGIHALVTKTPWHGLALTMILPAFSNLFGLAGAGALRLRHGRG